jgi:hypothetical protein
MAEQKTQEIKYKQKQPVELAQRDVVGENIRNSSGLLDSNAGVPTYSPKSFYDQFYLYENGATRRLYVYVNGTWRYSALT